MDEVHTPTGGPEIFVKRLLVQDTEVRIQVWDASGDDLMHYPSVCIPVIKGAIAAILVYLLVIKW